MLRRLIKFSLVGLLLQVIAHFITPLGGLFEPWLLLGEYLLPSGAEGHAFPVGAMVGWLAGVVVYALLLGGIIYLGEAALRRSEKSGTFALILIFLCILESEAWS